VRTATFCSCRHEHRIEEPICILHASAICTQALSAVHDHDICSPQTTFAPQPFRCLVCPSSILLFSFVRQSRYSRHTCSSSVVYLNIPLMFARSSRSMRSPRREQHASDDAAMTIREDATRWRSDRDVRRDECRRAAQSECKDVSVRQNRGVRVSSCRATPALFFVYARKSLLIKRRC